MKRGDLFKIILILILLCNFVSAIPQTISVQGRLTDVSNNPLLGNYNMNFKFYNTSTGGSSIWELDNQSVNVDNGFYSFIINDITLPFDAQYYLGVQVGSDAEMLPRINLTSSPYAFFAKNTTLSGVAIDSDLNLGNYNLTTLGGWTNGGVSIIGGDIYARTIFVYNISSININNLNVNGSLFPSLDNFFDIGSSSMRWKDIYQSGNIFSNGTGNNYFLGKVGIGTTSPGNKLSVQGDTGIGVINSANTASWSFIAKKGSGSTTCNTVCGTNQCIAAYGVGTGYIACSTSGTDPACLCVS